jgi:hypothetical protein
LFVFIESSDVVCALSGLAFDVRDGNNANLVRNLSSAITNKQGSVNLDSLDARNLDANTRSELIKLFPHIATPVQDSQAAATQADTQASIEEPDEVLEALSAHIQLSQTNQHGGSMSLKLRQESFDSTVSSTGSVPSSARATMFIPSHDVTALADTAHLQANTYTNTTTLMNMNALIASGEIFEFCSVEADLNYLLALSMNSTLPTYANSDGVLLGNMSTLTKKINSFFPSRLPSVCASTYPCIYTPTQNEDGSITMHATPNTNSSIDSVNSFCFPDGVSVEVHSLHAAELLTGPQHDQFHILQFTNAEGATSYACCLIVSMAAPLEQETLVSKACIEMSLQKIAAQRIKRSMRAYVVNVKKQRWQQSHSNTSGANIQAQGQPSSQRSLFGRGSVTGTLNADTSMHSTGAHSTTTTPTNSQQANTRSNRKSSTDSEPPSGFMSKYFGSSSREATPTPTHVLSPPLTSNDQSSVLSPTLTSDSPDTRKRSTSNAQPTTPTGALVNAAQAAGADVVSMLQQPVPAHAHAPTTTSTTNGAQPHAAQPATTSAAAAAPAPAPQPVPFPILDPATRAKLEGVAMALKKAKDAGLSSTCSPAMQMSEALLARHGLKFCDDESTHYMTPIVNEHTLPSLADITKLAVPEDANAAGTPYISATRTWSGSSVMSTQSSSANAQQGDASGANTPGANEGRKGYLSTFFGFSGRPKSKDSKSRPSSSDGRAAVVVIVVTVCDDCVIVCVLCAEYPPITAQSLANQDFSPDSIATSSTGWLLMLYFMCNATCCGRNPDSIIKRTIQEPAL